jgi:hypothetical protein
MAITALLGVAPYPAPLMSGALSLVSATFSEANGGYACVFQVPRSGDIRIIRWATLTVTTGATLDVRLETVDLATGDPSGSLWAANTNASQVVANGDDNTFFATTLTADATVVIGDLIAFVVKNPAVSHGNMSLSGTSWGTDDNLPYGDDHNGVGYTKSNVFLTFALEYSDGVIVPVQGILPPTTSQSTLTLTTSATPDVAGMLFTALAPMRVYGAWVIVDRDGDCHLRLVSTAYNQGAGTGILADVALDANVRRDAAQRRTPAYFENPFDLVVGTSYRLIVEPTTTTNVVLPFYNTGTANCLNAWAGGGCLTTAKDPAGNADWTDYNAGTFRWAPMGLLVGGIESGGSGSGGGSFTFVG